MAQAAPQFSAKDAKAARQYYQHIAAIINRLLNRAMQGLDDDGRKAFRPSVFHTIHALHAFFHGRDLAKKDLIVAHKFVTPYFDYTGHEDNAAKFMDRRLDALLEAERACGRRFIEIERADGETLLFTWYQSHPLLDAAEALYLEARRKPEYWKCASAAVTDEMLDRAIDSLPVVEPEPLTDADAEDDAEAWASDDLMTANVIKGMWTKVINNAERALEKEDDNGGDAALVAARVAAKIIDLGKAIKRRRNRELLRSAMAVRTPDEIADGHSLRIRPDPVSEALPEVQEGSGKDSVTTNGGGSEDFGEPTLDINVYPPVDETLDSQQLDNSDSADSSPDVLSFALDMARQGIAVFPVFGVADGLCDCPEGSECRSVGKHPIPALTPRGVKNATTDEATIRRWFTKEPHANLAWAMGGPLRLLGVDVDPRAGGDDSLCDLVEAHGDAWLETFTVRTGSLGNHFVYSVPADVEFRRGKLAPGIDLKFEGGYLVAPPSIHLSGRRYEVEKNVYIAPAPPWMIDELTRADGEPAKVPIDFQAFRDRKQGGTGPAIVEGERNVRLFKVGCALWGKGEVQSRAELLQRLQETNGERVSPPLDSDEVWKIAESIARHYPLGVPIEGSAA